MAISDYMRGLRSLVGPRLLLVPSVSGLVLDEHGRVLLVRDAGTRNWVVPGGAVDPDEAPEDAVVRELWEETGLLVEPVGLAGVFGGPEFRVRYANGDEVGYVTAVFECRRVGGELRVDGDEVSEARYVGPEELPPLRLSSGAKRVLHWSLAHRRGPAIPPVRWRPPGK